MNRENGKICILLIDDKLENAQEIKTKLDRKMRLPWEFAHCETLKEAQSRLSKADVIILELDLVNAGSKREVFKEIQDKVKDTPIIALTGKGKNEHELATYVMEMGAADVIIRGQFKQLIDAIEFSLIRQSIATNKRLENEDAIQKRNNARMDRESDRKVGEEKTRQTLRMFMGDYSVDKSEKK